MSDQCNPDGRCDAGAADCIHGRRPAIDGGCTVNLPKAGAQALTGDDEPLAISVNQGGQIFIEERS